MQLGTDKFTVHINPITNLIRIGSEDKTFLKPGIKLASGITAPIQNVCINEIAQYYEANESIIKTSSNGGFCEPKIIRTLQHNFLVQLHYFRQTLIDGKSIIVLYFNYIEMDHYSLGKTIMGSYLEEKGLKIQLQAAYDQISLILEEKLHEKSLDGQFYKSL